MDILKAIMDDPESKNLDRVFRISPCEVKDEDLDRVIAALRLQRSQFIAAGEKPSRRKDDGIANPDQGNAGSGNDPADQG